ncbi:Gfo/Idh/MocA family oxidoreductase [Herbiconiux moechotypicola]|uniref:Gfo/Idh/MocA family oxidoreductase n=1 Tax=Herbiconiux moechotypicola TaxID=637393 RepID=A0ABN3DPH6_9MICO|nr:Gfo/Idh/MocA family oxidoreductase [Herbiconiux moechotypicola]MCS5731676.1 Gfo/Idh/MocA family oxidoreductase [Herbiconiux moechotypicola]
MTNSSRVLKYGMVGGGDVSSVGELHRNALRLNGDAELVAGVFSHDLEKSRRTGAELGVDASRIYASADEMAEREAAREDGIDFVDISTPNAYHYAASKAFLELGIHVACEKPLCLTPEEGVDLEEVAARTGALFCLMHTFTGHAMSREARALYEDGVIGELRTVVVEYPQDWLVDALEKETEETKTWRSIPALSGRGAAIGDIGSHMENWVHYVTGLGIHSVLANLEALGSGTMLDNNFQVITKFENGASGFFWGSQVAVGYDNAFKVMLLGEKGSLEFWQENNNYLVLRLRDQPMQVLSRGSAYSRPESLKYLRTPKGHPEGLTEAFANIYSAFADAIRDRRDGTVKPEQEYGYPTLAMGVAGVRFFNACVDSQEAGNAWVEL